jgi:Mg-chelatase subunit ChlI
LKPGLTSMAQNFATKRSPTPFPFTAVKGMRTSKEALLLLAIDAGLKGVLIAGGPGTGKGLLAAAFGGLLADPQRPGGPPFIEVPPRVTEDGLLGRI